MNSSGKFLVKIVIQRVAEMQQINECRNVQIERKTADENIFKSGMSREKSDFNAINVLNYDGSDASVFKLELH